MIVVDTSAIVAILLDEVESVRCKTVLQSQKRTLVSAGTLSEAYVVAESRDLTQELGEFLGVLGLEIVPVTASTARCIGDIYSKWGRGAGTAGLNFGDCFAYELAQRHACPLLYVGDDFGKTDVISAI